MDLVELIQKYTVSGPRYTSYPTAPQWTEEVGCEHYANSLKQLTADQAVSLYIHIPFCESLCYYCGCNIHITKDKERSRKYLDAIQAELSLLRQVLPSKMNLSHMAWGGGTPTFLNPEQIVSTVAVVRDVFDTGPNAEVSIEIDPRVTSREHLQTLREVGFNRVSLGVQDFDPEVQRAVNRIQDPQLTEGMVRDCRELGFRAVNFDLIYGLPFQTLESFERTIATVNRIRPDRIALYNYAHLPQLRSHQVILEKFPMPDAEERLGIFLMALDQLRQSGYRSIGMDHFALESDELFVAFGKKRLYRNFQGYTVKHADHLIGIGASAISEVNGNYFQNVRETKTFEETLQSRKFATFRGCLLSGEDLRRKWVIQNLMCRFELLESLYANTFKRKLSMDFASEFERLDPLRVDGLVDSNKGDLRVTELGRFFVRNIAMLFDPYLNGNRGATYSKTL